MDSIGVRKLALVMVVGLILASMLACEIGGGAAKPTVNVTAPTSGIEVQVGEEVNVLSTATDSKGVVRVELAVDGVPYRTDASSSPDGDLTLTAVQTWVATDLGMHTLTVTAYNVDGVASDPWAITVEVVEGPGAEETPTPTVAAGTPPPPPPTATPLPPTGTPPPPPPTATSPPATPEIAYFRANGTEGSISVAPGTTVTLSWEWARVDEGYLDPGNIPMACPAMPCTYDVSPAATTTYTLRASNAAGTDEATVTVQIEALPDLYITELSLDPVSPHQGQLVNVRVAVYNGGNAPAGHQRVIWRAAGPTVGCEWDIASLAALGGRVLNCTYTYSGWNPNYITTAVADVDDEVAESDEENNSRELVVNVQPAVAGPDLYITELSLDPVSPHQGELVNVRVAVYNGGNAAAGHHKVIWRAAGPTVGCEWDIASLVAHGGRVLNCTYTYLGWNPNYVTTAVADVDGEVAEGDETNNSRELIVNVQPAP